jgi:hypothetical protein
MRRLAIAGGCVVLLLAASIGIVEASKGPRLDGSFNVTGTVQGNDIGIPAGTATTDVYVFKSTCPAGACAKVRLTRDAGERKVQSTLKKTAPGVYRGTEGPAPYTCVDPIGTKGTFTGDHKIVVTKAKDGRAKKISGTIEIHITGSGETYEDAALKGALK